MRIPERSANRFAEPLAPVRSSAEQSIAPVGQRGPGVTPLPAAPLASVHGPSTKETSGAAQPGYLFARRYGVDEILTDPTKAQRFAEEYLDHEAKFFALARNPETGLTYDGVNLDLKTGEVVETRPFSAPSKECLDIGVCLKALGGDAQAARVVGRGDPMRARRVAIDILAKKMRSYEGHHRDYPGYGGFLPWFKNDGGPLRPTDDWVGDAPGLDNGEWVWTLLVAESVLRREGFADLADRYGAFNRLLRAKVVEMFYDPEACRMRADVHVVDPRSLDSAYETIRDKRGRATFLTGEHGVHEGVMLVLYATLFGEGLPPGVADRTWTDIAMKRIEHEHGTTWEAFWGSAHESWAHLFLPMRDLKGYRDLFRVREKIRTQNAAKQGYPGFATSTNQPGSHGYVGYLDGAGIEGIGSQVIRNNHVYAVYGAFPLLLEFAGQYVGNYGLAWLVNMLHAPKAQGPLGGGESGTNDGTAVSPIKTIDGSFPNVLAMLGGIAGETAEMLREQGVYDAFVARMQSEFDEAFGAAPLRDPSDFARPTASVSQDLLADFVPSVPLKARLRTAQSVDARVKRAGESTATAMSPAISITPRSRTSS